MRIVANVLKDLSGPKTRHYTGMPPFDEKDPDRRILMECATVLLIEDKSDGIFLTRFSVDGKCVGDTWHTSVTEAKEQADFEFQNFVSEWILVPEAIDDVVRFSLEKSD
jgi:hypothetical protein